MTDDLSTNSARKILEGRLIELSELEKTNSDSRNTVVLDQSSVGRLSRMDAIQQQAMAKATLRKRKVEAMAIKAALIRLQDGEYGYCDDCGEEIPAKRLQLNPTAVRCVNCAVG